MGRLAGAWVWCASSAVRLSFVGVVMIVLSARSGYGIFAGGGFTLTHSAATCLALSAATCLMPHCVQDRTANHYAWIRG